MRQFPETHEPTAITLKRPWRHRVISPAASHSRAHLEIVLLTTPASLARSSWLGKGRPAASSRCTYKKNDQAFVEQKNGAVVRRLVGYGRFEGFEAAQAMARLYAGARLYVNFFQPSFKLKEKRREGAKVIKRYHAPATPFERALAHRKVTRAVMRIADALASVLP